MQEAPHPTAAQAAPRCRPIGFSTGLSRGTLRPEDVDELRKLSAQSDPAAFDELRRRIVVALNRDEIRLAEPRAGMP